MATEEVFDKVYVEIGKLIDKKPTSKSQKWIKSQRMVDKSYII